MCAAMVDFGSATYRPQLKAVAARIDHVGSGRPPLPAKGTRPPIRRQIYLDHGVTIEAPRLMTDDQLADVLDAFIKTVKETRHRRKAAGTAAAQQPATSP